jgi:4-diphosphocytidyl-2-C-methyl-D-erythritol kinase
MTADGYHPRAAAGVVTTRAHAKLTLSLHVTGVRDDGFHLIDAEMITLDLHDRLEIDPTGDSLTITGAYAEGLDSGPDNLIRRALDLVGRRAAVILDKQIPHGGGLGGGSADAAAILRWAEMTDPIAAARLGADIPFCLIGGRARVTGIGEIIEPLTPQPLTVTLIVPPLRCSTPAVYRAWDELGGPSHATNDLEPAALVVEPQLGMWQEMIATAAGDVPRLAGSGSTMFVIGDHGAALAKLEAQGATVIVTKAAATNGAAGSHSRGTPGPAGR